MNSFMKAKKEEKKSSNCEATVKPTEKEKKEETKTSSAFTFKDFQKSINKKESDTKTSTPAQTNSNSSLTVEKRNDEKLTKEELKKEEKKEVEKKKEKEKKTKDDYEEEIESEIESDSDSDIEFESDDDDDEYKIVKIKLIPFIFTEKYEQVKGFIKDSRITCYSFLNVINNGIMSDIEFKEIEKRVKDKLSEILIINDEHIKLKINKDNDSLFTFDCYVKIYDDTFSELFYDNDDNQIIKYTIRKYQKHYKDIYKKEYDDEEDFFDYFKYLKDFLNIYLKIIYGGYDWHPKNEISKIIEKDFTINRVNPFTYNENIIPFREIRTKSKDVIKTTIMKMGFVFNYVSEIKKE